MRRLFQGGVLLTGITGISGSRYKGPLPRSVVRQPSLIRMSSTCTTAFQPIVDVNGAVFAYEALVRGEGGEPAKSVFSKVAASDLRTFEHLCRIRALEAAVRTGLDCRLSLNISPSELAAEATGPQATIRAAGALGFPTENLILEIGEREEVADFQAARRALDDCRRSGMQIALDDFGTGYASLNPLVELMPDIIKLDIGLVRDVDRNVRKQTVIQAILQVCRQLGITVIGEGVETEEEARVLRGMGVCLFQGYHFGRPAVRV